MAAKTIKGITVKIGGDITGLGKALKEVETHSDSLTRSLKAINDALKLDPGNVELLSSKQKILTEAVDETSEKLRILEDVQDQVRQQYADGDIDHGAYADFQKELIYTRDKLKKLEGQLSDTEKALDGTGDDAKKAAKKVDQFADAADDAEDSSKGLGEAVKDAFAAFGAASLIESAVDFLGEAVEETKEYRTEMNKLDAAYLSSGKSSDTARLAYDKLFRVVGETDQCVEAAQQIALLAQSEKDVAKWSGLASGLYGKFGDSLQPETFYESANETLKLGEATGAFTQMLEGCGFNVDDFNTKLAACTTEQEKLDYMLSVANGALGETGASYELLAQDIIAANEAEANWTEATAGIGEVVTPAMTELQNLAAELLVDLTPAIATGIEYLGGFFELLDGLVEKYEALSPEQRENIDMLAGFAESVALATDPIGPAIEAIDELAAMFTTAYEKCDWFRDGVDRLFGGLGDILLNWRQNATETWDNVTSGLADLGQGFAEIGADIEQGWTDLWNGIKKTASDLIDGAKEKIDEGIRKIKGLFDFEWDWPKLKLPHWSLTGSFSLNPPSVPKLSVEWYAKGGILDGAQIFGRMGNTFLGGGEAGKEAVLPLTEFYGELEKIMTRNTGGLSGVVVNVNIQRFENHTDQDVSSLTDEIADQLFVKLQREEVAFA